jgi:exopolyphosphatase/guanosine-5'-triphosphate,3'-diphosphate pyrophosphatase
MRRRIVLLLWLVAILAFGGCASTPDVVPPPPKPTQRCKVRRAAFDVGSGTTKFKVAEVDVCTKTILAVLDAGHAPVFYGDDLGKGERRFKDATMKRGLDVLQGFKQRCSPHKPEAYAAVATAAFRRADNSRSFLERIEREVGIPISLITQQQEAHIGFMGAVRAAQVDPKGAVVWDVGSRSMQITTLTSDGSLEVYEGVLASGQMRSHMIHAIQGKTNVKSPNPVTREHADAAIAYAKAYATEHLPAPLRARLAKAGTVVVGIGATKYYGDRPAAEAGAACRPSHLSAKIDDLIGKSDADIGGDYAATAVSDRLLLLGFMQALNIAEVRLADIDLTDGLLFESEYYPADK